MKFCSNCGQSIQQTIPEGDNRMRFVCSECDIIHYQNPRIITGCLVTHRIGSEEKVLLCKRAIEPRLGCWTLPAGFMENGETTIDGARRETFEEALAKVDIEGLYTVFSLPHISQVHMFFRGTLAGEFAPGSESLEVELFAEDEIPWQQLAFPVITQTLEHYFEDRKTNQFPTHYKDIVITRKKRP